MLQAHKPILANELAGQGADASPAELYALIVGFLRRQYPVIVCTLVLIALLGVAYLAITPPKYMGNAVLLIDTHKTQVFQPQQSPLGDLPIDSATVDTQIEVLKSENIGLSVIQKLHLDQDPEFIMPRPGLIGGTMGLLMRLLPSGKSAGSEASADFQRLRTALWTLESNLTVKRIGLTYAIEIDFQSLSPDRAAEVANAVAEAYVADAMNAKDQTTRRAASWLEDRLKELRQQSSNAERAVVEYRAKNNIVDTGKGLMNEQQLAELNSTLVQDRAATAEAKARLEQVQQLLDSPNPDPADATTAMVTDSLHNDVITKLRQQYLDLSTKDADWSARYGPQHQAVVNVRTQMQELRRAILDELRRIAETYRNEYEIAKAREDSVQKSLDAMVAQSQTMNEAQITLHNLDSSAETYRTLYDSFLQRYMESVQQQSFPVTDARLITRATRPLQKSAPKAPTVLALAALGGLMLGIGWGMLREISDHAVRTTAQIQARLQSECLGVLPLTKRVAGRAAAVRPAADRADEPRTIRRDPNLLWNVVEQPFSRFAETVRGIKVAADLMNNGKPCKVIAVTSALPNEGKSTVALALAQAVSLGGGRAVLVDCDLRNPSLSDALAPGTEGGLVDLAFGKLPLREALWREPLSNLSFIPAGGAAGTPETSFILGCEATRKFFEALRQACDYVILDLPPLAPVVDVRAMTHLVDSFVLVVEWGRTDIETIEHALGSARGVYDNLLGVILNKVNMKAFARYEGHRESYYHDRSHLRYAYAE